jgi:hypothetical protein
MAFYGLEEKSAQALSGMELIHKVINGLSMQLLVINILLLGNMIIGINIQTRLKNLLLAEAKFISLFLIQMVLLINGILTALVM